MDNKPELECYKVDDVRFDDIIGMTEIKDAAKKMEQGGGSMLLYGPHATGKNMFGRALAGEFGMYLSMSTFFYSYYVTRDLVENLRLAFEEIEKRERFVLFIDDFELIFDDRRFKADNVHARMREELKSFLQKRLVELRAQGISVIVIAATGHPEKIDPSYFKDGIFERVFYTDYPDSDMRREALRRELECFKPEDDIIEDLTKITEGLTIFDIHRLSNNLKSFMIYRLKQLMDEGKKLAFNIVYPSREEFERCFTNDELVAENNEERSRFEAWRRENGLM